MQMKEINVLDYGAVGNGVFDNSHIFSDIFSNDNIKVVIPAGTFLTGPVRLKSNTTVVLEKGSILKFSDNPNLYKPVYSRWEGVRCWCMHPCIYAEHEHDVVITGEGTIDGNGSFWWRSLRQKIAQDADPQWPIEKTLASLNKDYRQQPGGGGGRKTQYLRPSLLRWDYCEKITLSGVTVTNSPCWTVHPVFSENIEINNITIINPYDSPNTDAIDIDSCRNVHISGCNITVGDDAICLKSGSGQDGIDAGVPTENIVVENCFVMHSHGAVVIGSETAAGIKNAVFRNCVFNGTDRGIRIKSRRGRGGSISDILFCDIKMDKAMCPVVFNMFYKCGTKEDWPFTLEKLEKNSCTPSISNVTIENLVATDCSCSAGFFAGLPESPVKNVMMKNCRISIAPNACTDTDNAAMSKGLLHVEGRGIRIINSDIAFDDVQIEGTMQPFIYG